MGFDGLISASSSGSSQNILLQDLYIVFQCFVCFHCSWKLPAYSSPKPMLSGTLRSDDGDVCANVKKKIGFEYQNKNFALAAHFFVHYFTLTARLRHENALFAKTKRDFFFSFWTWIWFLEFQLQNSSSTFGKVSEWNNRDEDQLN